MMESFSISEKMKNELSIARFEIYRRFDEQARDIMDEARSSGTLKLNGENETDPLRTELVEKILSLINLTKNCKLNDGKTAA